MIRLEWCKDREAWLENRLLGGSDAAAILGISPWMSNTQLWRIKAGIDQPKDLGGNPVVDYGTKAEEHLRQLFALDFPEYEVLYKPFNIFKNDDYPFASASLDGWLVDQEGRKGVLEIKTALIQNKSQSDKWDGKIPDYYYTQVLWNMAVSGAAFAVLAAQLKWEREDDVMKITRHYKVKRKDVQGEIDYLMQKGEEFADSIERGICPPTILPGI